jgi:uncharacterized protein
MDKVFISAATMEQDSWAFAVQLHKLGEHFDWVIGVTRGGAQISVYIQETLSLLDENIKSYATIHAYSYTGIGEAKSEVIVRDLEPLLQEIKHGESILVIDDVFDRGATLNAIKEKLDKRLQEKQATVKLGVLYYKPENSTVSIAPDYFFRTYNGDDWLVFPHELCGLSQAELRHKGFPIDEI